MIDESKLPLPSWWDGPLNRKPYKAATGREPYKLGASYRGVDAIGPRPLSDHAPDVLVIFPGGHGEYMNECVELSMRFLWLAYGIPAYQANGFEVVKNYRKSMPGKTLTAIPNDAAAPCPSPGDVLAYGTVSPGHTSVCMGRDVDAGGFGTITVMEQNNSKEGRKVLPVRAFKVIASPAVTAFLHYPIGGHIDMPEPPISTTPGSTRFFPETQHNISNAFLAFWLAEPKALSYFGFPLTEEVREVLSDGKTYTVQYFERARFEYHPELAEGQKVLLGLVGAELEAIRKERHPQGE